MGDFFAFRRMLAPLLIHLLFWFAVLSSMSAGIYVLIGSDDLTAYLEKNSPVRLSQLGDNLKLVVGVGLIVLGPITARLYCELLMLPFRINGTLTDIRNSLLAREEEGLPPPRPQPRR